MAKQVIHKITDDLDGSDADETIQFGLDGSVFEIDLSEKNAVELREVLDRYVTAGSRIGRMSPVMTGTAPRGAARPRYAQPPAQGGTDRELNRAIREWASAAGKTVSERGRIPGSLIEEYHNRDQRPPAAENGNGKKPRKAAKKAAFSG